MINPIKMDDFWVPPHVHLAEKSIKKPHLDAAQLTIKHRNPSRESQENSCWNQPKGDAIMFNIMQPYNILKDHIRGKILSGEIITKPKLAKIVRDGRQAAHP